MYFIYNILAVLLVILALPVFAVRSIHEKGFAERLKQSLGWLPEATMLQLAGKDVIWLHAASVGEIVAASPIVKEIRHELPGIPILVSVVTAAGHAMAKRIIPEADGIIFFPLDLPFLSRAVITKIRPRVFLLVETELWPNFLKAARDLNIPVMMVNGRISEKSLGRYCYFRSVLKDMLNTIVKFCMQSTIDAQYITRLGADVERVVVTGNTKFDQSYTKLDAAEKAALYQAVGLRNPGSVIVAGSTHKGEEELLFAAFNQIVAEFPDTQFIVAPRDILRAGEIAELASRYKFTSVRRTKLAEGESLDLTNINMIIIDTIGELGKIYGVADIVYIGGSLVPRGGHNILEPAAHGKPILIGPHMFNFKDTYALLSERGACVTVKDSASVAETILGLLKNPAEARRMGNEALTIIKENQGASRKSAVHLKEVLQTYGLLKTN
ncbi:3-deoxy-D-manno-octulosonic acid transferase [Sporomusa sp.]|uniref:3-deoxy-D-manno-octulosonic acid transferase n=1 Tax=Sporomusa sp. TaxID=2078658 RepID=UPI002C84AF12|nr:3-deoxy-D-manno-octulosonic acid transferase [Sporomusa sp.]HWR05912.1 3-deoxy-D-manno-octulosonic acid transferase [Sporomusa sp.]